MDTFETVLLGILQGVTEFLPVSSSGHLAAAKLFFDFDGIEAAPLLLDILLHVATVLAVIIFYRKYIGQLFSDAFGSIKRSLAQSSVEAIKNNDSVKMLLFLLAGTIPTGIIGYFMQKSGVATSVGESNILLGISFLSCSAILVLTKFEKKEEVSLCIQMAILIGIAQGFAVLPGISRSGATIAAALIMGVKREEAVRFSFLLSIPAILGAAVLEMKLDIFNDMSVLLPVLIGVISAFLVGFFCLFLLVKIVKAGRLWAFAPYVLLMGLLVIFMF